ncbi:MAG: plasmid mobilization relaxosome protein MobC [Defluviitaleaceae bacterium]|nr:plasmid mobilization relaxosome protein MobC [Defluviitaleaceae bacterium]
MDRNRKRKIRVEVRLTDDERDLLLRRMNDARITNMQSYVRNMALMGYILRMDVKEVREALRLMANATNNINQVAKRANETRSIYAADMIELREEVGNLRLQVSDALKVFGKVQKLLNL